MFAVRGKTWSHRMRLSQHTRKSVILTLSLCAPVAFWRYDHEFSSSSKKKKAKYKRIRTIDVNISVSMILFSFVISIFLFIVVQRARLTLIDSIQLLNHKPCHNTVCALFHFPGWWLVSFQRSKNSESMRQYKIYSYHLLFWFHSSNQKLLYIRKKRV